MRAWNDEEKALIAASRAARDRARRRRAWIVRGAIAAVVLIAGFGVGSWFLYRQSQDRLAVSASRELSARALSVDASRRDVAMLYGVAAYESSPTFEAQRALLSEVGRDPMLIRVIPTSAAEIVFTPDGNRLAAVEEDGIRLYDIATGTATLAPNPPEVFDRGVLSFDGNGTAYTGIVKVDSAALETVVGVWELETGKELGIVRLPMESVDRRVEWTLGPPMPDDRRLVSVVDGRDIVLWDLTTAAPVRRLRSPVPPTATFFSRDGSMLAATSDSGAIIVWDVTKGRTIKTVRSPVNAMTNVVISPDNSAMMATVDRTLTMWWLHTNREPRRLSDSTFSHAAFVGDGSALVVHAAAGQVRVFDSPLDPGQYVDALEPSRTLYGVGDIPSDLITSLQRRRIATIYDGFVHVWDLDGRRPGDAGDLVKTSRLPIGPDREIVFLSPDGKLALEKSVDHLAVWDVAGGRLVGDSVPFVESDTLSFIYLAGPGVELGGSGRFILAPKLELGRNRARQLFDRSAPDGSPALSARNHTTPGIEPLGTRVAYGLLATRSVVVDDLARPGAPDTLDPGPRPGEPLDSIWTVAPAFSRGGDFLVAQQERQQLLLWDLAKKTVRDSFGGMKSYASQLYVSDDGSTAAASQQSLRIVTFWRHGTPTPISTLRGLQIGGMRGSALSPDGRLFAFATHQTVVIADVARGEVIVEIMLGVGTGTVAFVDGGRTLLAVGTNGRVDRITLDPGAWAEEACRIAASPQALERFRDDAPAGVQVPARCRGPQPR